MFLLTVMTGALKVSCLILLKSDKRAESQETVNHSRQITLYYNVVHTESDCTMIGLFAAFSVQMVNDHG